MLPGPYSRLWSLCSIRRPPTHPSNCHRNQTRLQGMCTSRFRRPLQDRNCKPLRPCSRCTRRNRREHCSHLSRQRCSCTPRDSGNLRPRMGRICRRRPHRKGSRRRSRNRNRHRRMSRLHRWLLRYSCRPCCPYSQPPQTHRTPRRHRHHSNTPQNNRNPMQRIGSRQHRSQLRCNRRPLHPCNPPPQIHRKRRRHRHQQGSFRRSRSRSLALRRRSCMLLLESPNLHTHRIHRYTDTPWKWWPPDRNHTRPRPCNRRTT